MITALLLSLYLLGFGLCCLLFVWACCTVSFRTQRRRSRRHAGQRRGALPQDTFWGIVEANWPPPSSDWLAAENRRRFEAGDIPIPEDTPPESEGAAGLEPPAP